MKKADIINELKKTLQENKDDLKRHNMLIEAAEKNKGQINKKIVKYLPEGSEFVVRYGMYHVGFPNNKEHLIGWERSTTELTKESIEHSDSCYGRGSRERIETIENILNNPEILEAYCKKYLDFNKTLQKFKKEHEAIESMELLNHYDPCNYQILEMMGIKNNCINRLFEEM
jgi:hypothetical protein